METCRNTDGMNTEHGQKALSVSISIFNVEHKWALTGCGGGRTQVQHNSREQFEKIFIIQSARYLNRYLAGCVVGQAGLRVKDEAESAAGEQAVEQTDLQLAGRQKVTPVALTEMRRLIRRESLGSPDSHSQTGTRQEVNRRYSWSGTEGCCVEWKIRAEQ